MVNADFLVLIVTDEQSEQCCSDGRMNVSTFMAESAGRCRGRRMHDLHHCHSCIATHHLYARKKFDQASNCKHQYRDSVFLRLLHLCHAACSIQHSICSFDTCACCAHGA